MLFVGRSSLPLAAAIAATAVLTGCGETPVVRNGPVQQRVVSRTYPVTIDALHQVVLDRFANARATLPMPFRQFAADALVPPRFSEDWLATFVDFGGFLDEYKRMPAADKLNDVVLQEPIGDLYWPSEYATATGPVQFRCGWILHLVPAAAGVEVQVFEFLPTVWAGEHWAMSAHGVGFGRYHDIRQVEPTVKDRVDVLDLLDRLTSTGR